MEIEAEPAVMDVDTTVTGDADDDDAALEVDSEYTEDNSHPEEWMMVLAPWWDNGHWRCLTGREW